MKQLKRILTICCCFVMVFAVSLGVFAAEDAMEFEQDTELLSTGVFPADTGLTFPSLFPIYNADTEAYEDKTYFVPSVVLSSGIDVSKHQGNIDWKAVKNAGVDFVFVRVAYRGYETGNLGEDSYFRKNIEEAQKAGIRVGAYVYSQAVNEDEAREEAAYLMHRVANYKMDMPLVFDYEFAGKDTRLYNAYFKDLTLNKEKGTDVCLAFCDYVKANGYDAMVYANASMLSSNLNADRLGETAEIWLANFNDKPTYGNNIDYWQYSDKGKVKGIGGNVDCDFAFVNRSYASGSGCFPFTDVNGGQWFYDEVKYAYDHDLFNGIEWDTFSPNNTMTRAMLVSVLYRMSGSPAVSGKTAFTDVVDNSWYESAVIWAVQNGIVKGVTETTFEPESTITREQMASLLHRYAAYRGYGILGLADLGRFSDSGKIADYAVPAMRWAVARSYISGFPDSTLGPQKGATRAEVASILQRFCDGNRVYEQ